MRWDRLRSKAVASSLSRISERAPLQPGSVGASGITADRDALGLDRVALAVPGEVRAHAAHEQRVAPEAAQAEGDVAGDTAAPDLQVADKERHGDLVELVRDQRVGELPGEGHQVVGCDRPGDSYPHR